MTKVKLKRSQARNLYIALIVCSGLEVPSKFRYAIAKNLRSLEAEFKSTDEAFKEPKTDTVEHDQWQSEFQAHLNEEIETELYCTPLVEINDTVNVDEKNRARQNQALIDALLPIWIAP